MINPSTGLPANRIYLTDQNEVKTTSDSTPSDMALMLADFLVMRDMQLIDPLVSQTMITQLISTLSKLETHNGLFYNWYDTTSLNRSAIHHSGGVIEPFISTVDNAWLAASLMLIASVNPETASQAETILNHMNFPELYDPKEDLFWGGKYPKQDKFTPHHYTALGSEIRVAPYVGIAQFEMSPKSYQTLYEKKHKKGVVVRSWGGSMFEALLPPLIIPESKWSKEWADSHRGYIERQMRYGRRFSDKYWGFSPCDDPSNTYQEFGVHSLGIHKGYHQSSVITPHASFLALPFKKLSALHNLARLEQINGVYREGYGFGDSVDVRTGEVARSHLAIDDSMILLSIAESCGLGVSRYLERRLENKLRPVIESSK